MSELTLKTASQALQTAPIGTLILNNKNEIEWYNDTLLELLGLTQQQLAAKSAEALQQDARTLLLSPPETIFLQQGERERWIRCYRQSSDNGSQTHFYIDISREQQLQLERDRLAEELQTLTTRDPLTGLSNQRALLQGLEPLVSRSRRYGNPLSVIELKIDSGEQSTPEQNDSTCIKISQMLKDQMRWADLIGRIDNSDFLLILPETPEESARQLAEKICSLSDELQIEGQEGKMLQPRTYCGVAGWSKGDDSTRLLQRANDEIQAIAQT